MTAFTAEDFGEADNFMCEYAAKIANARLAEMKKAWLAELLEGAPLVYGTVEFGWWDAEPQDKHKDAHHVDTHTARLVDIREIKK